MVLSKDYKYNRGFNENTFSRTYVNFRICRIDLGTVSGTFVDDFSCCFLHDFCCLSGFICVHISKKQNKNLKCFAL